MTKLNAAFAAFLLLLACGGSDSEAPDSSLKEDAENSVVVAATPEVESADANGDDTPGEDSIARAAEDFVKLALAVGVHDGAFVDAYHGPEEWREEAEEAAVELDALETEANALLIRVSRLNADETTIRGVMLEKLARAALARLNIVRGETYPFNQETKLLYDAIAPDYDVGEFYAALSTLDTLVPGDAPLHERIEEFRNSLAIPEDKLLEVFNAAIAECRRRTLEHYELPDNESFSLEFVTDKPWSGYNWYQGGFESLIQVNTDFPIIIDRAIDLGCHEGYPGHHTWNIMLERDLLNEAGWIEYSVYPLFSPLSITAEGSANYGIELAFPGDEKIAFERDILFPIAGLDPAKAETLDKLNTAKRKLSHARNHVARLYLDEQIDRDEAIRMMMEFGVQSEERAEQSVRFTETYRGYVINYNLGRDLVENYIERLAADSGDRWGAFETLLTTPLAASDLAAIK
ncbi:MAG: hypothetical protein HKN14_14935 [Marinicaulis sp.]|nr:hypothetical protein [Marinicaulis sp.]NNE42202.1 hypothetical protein [Marinicaulis sp.]NNL89098.1 hypothetical protein [Marinicaulis sp.]